MNMNMNIATVKFVFIFNLSYPAVGSIVDINIIINIVCNIMYYDIILIPIDLCTSSLMFSTALRESLTAFRSAGRLAAIGIITYTATTTTTYYKYEIGNIYV